MSVGHEVIKPEINHVLSSPDKRMQAIIRRRDHFGGVNTLHFMRWREEGEPLVPKRKPEGWEELRPKQAIETATLEDARKSAKSFMEQIRLGDIDDQFLISQYQPPLRSERVLELTHEAGKLMAIILKHPSNDYEVRYFTHQLLGVWKQSGTEEWDWVRTRWELKTCADDLPSAETAAKTEMEILATAETPPSVQDWFRWVGE